MEEVWKDVKDYEGIYQVSNLGRVRSNYYEDKILKNHCGAGGYCRVGLYKGGKVTTKYVHHLVYYSFVKVTTVGKELNHIDGDKTNNILSNLELVTPSQNTLHAYKNNLAKKGERHYLSKLKTSEVIEIKKDYDNKKCTQVELAKKYNVTRQAIHAIVRGKTWK